MKIKNLTALFIACLCLFTCAFAEDAAVPSPSLKAPTVQVVIGGSETTGADAAADAEIAEDKADTALVIQSVNEEQMPESTAKLFEQIQLLQQPMTEVAADTEAAQEDAPVQMQPMKVDLAEIVPEETITAIVEKLPETSKIEELVITEFIPLTVANYSDDLGDVQIQIVSAIEYKPEETLTALVGIWDGEKMVWFVPELVSGEEGIYLNFTAEMLALMEGGEPVLMLMSDMQMLEQEQPAEQTL